jgi:predicted AlkP superfamily phosphohydrolase/phosphomutase
LLRTRTAAIKQAEMDAEEVSGSPRAVEWFNRLAIAPNGDARIAGSMVSMTAREHKTVVFGLDGACFDLIGPWLEAGALPTLRSLIDRGGRAPLTSCVPATTPPAWTSLTTGVNPGKHGVFGFYRRHRDEYDVSPVTDADVSARRLWDYTSETGLRSLVVNVPVTHPARELAGVLVPGYLAPSAPATYPPDVLEAVDMPDYRVYAPSEADTIPEGKLLEEWLTVTEQRKDLTLRLLDAYEWDLLFVEFQKPDGAVHKFADRSRVRRIYERVDDCLATILEAVPGEPNVVVVSDHGIGQPKQWTVALNTWFIEEGYVTTTTDEAADRSWLDRAAGGEDEEGDDVDPVRTLFAWLAQNGVTKQQLERALSTVGLYDLAARLAPEGAGAGLREEVVDRAASEVFYEGMGFSGVDVGVVVNDERFYADGIVSADNYDALREEVMAALRELSGPDGEHAFTRVRPREAVCEGERTPEAPDIVLEQAADYVIGSAYPRGATFSSAAPDRVDHTRDGLLIAAGPDIEARWEFTSPPSVMDVTPTLLHLLDVPLNERFDGRVLEGVLSFGRAPAVAAYEPFERGGEAVVTDEEAAALEDRLRNMGYLE